MNRISKLFCQGLFLLALLATTSGLSFAGHPRQPSLIMPLATKSLVLDLTRAGDRLVAVGWRGHILISDDNAQSWQQVETPTRTMLTSVYFTDAMKGWAAGHGAVILGTEDGGKSWKMLSAAPQEEQPLFDIIVTDNGYGFAIGAYAKFMITEDVGKSWKPADFVIEKSPEETAQSSSAEESLPFDYHLNGIARAADGTLYVAAEAGSLFRSDNNGKSWKELPSPYTGSFYGILTLDKTTLLAYGLRGHIFRSRDRGQHWVQIPTGVDALLTNAIKLPDDTIVITGMAGTILISSDAGLKFSLKQLNRTALTSTIQAADGTLVIAGERGPKTYKLSTFKKTK